ncbi:hypothetical protein Tco_1231618 [Tanacetum coccineum]
MKITRQHELRKNWNEMMERELGEGEDHPLKELWAISVSPDFKMPDENQILLKVHRQHNMYSFDMKTPSLTKDCLFDCKSYI